MKTPRNLSAFALAAALSLAGPTAHAQQQPPPQNDQAEDVLRINAEPVQTGVMVFDKQGRFVEGLKPEQFELKVDGKPVQLSFFDRVTTGTEREEKLATCFK